MQTSVGVQHESKEWITLRPTARSPWLEHVARRWTANVVGQPQATDSILRLLQRIEAQAGNRGEPWAPLYCSGRPAAERPIP